MRDKMETDEGRAIYGFRKITVEPVIGQLKENFGFRQFCLRGLEGARIEIKIVSIVHNLKKIWNRLREREDILEKNRDLNEENIIFEFYFVEIDLIVGRRLLLSEGEERSDESSAFPERLKGAKAYDAGKQPSSYIQLPI